MAMRFIAQGKSTYRHRYTLKAAGWWWSREQKAWMIVAPDKDAEAVQIAARLKGVKIVEALYTPKAKPAPPQAPAKPEPAKQLEMRLT